MTTLRSSDAATPLLPAENVTHPLMLDPATSAARAAQGWASRRGHRTTILGTGALDLHTTLDDAFGESATQFLQQMLSHGRAALGHEGLQINVSAGVLGNLRHARGGAISALIRLERAPRQGDARTEGRLLTVQRWAEEAKMLHGKFEQSRLSKLNNHVVVALLPSAVKAWKKAKEAEEREQERLREEQARAAAVEAAEKAKAEEEAKAAEVAAQVAADAAVAAAAAAQEAPSSTPDNDVEMADVTEEPAAPGDEPSTSANGPETAESSAGAGASAPERVTVMIMAMRWTSHRSNLPRGSSGRDARGSPQPARPRPARCAGQATSGLLYQR